MEDVVQTGQATGQHRSAPGWGPHEGGQPVGIISIVGIKVSEKWVHVQQSNNKKRIKSYLFNPD